MKLAIHTLAALLIASAAAAQQPAAPDSTPTCAESLEGIRTRVEANYAGFLLEIHHDARRRPEYERMAGDLRTRAAATNGDACLLVLRDFVDWFQDPHLFVFQSTRLDTAETARRARAAARVDLTEASVREHLQRNAGRLDRIEGIWYDGVLRVAIVPEPNAPAGRFVAVVLRGDSAIWQPGTVRARFTRRPDGQYETELWQRNYASHQVVAGIHRNLLLRFPPGMWGRELPAAGADSGLLDPEDPRRPTLDARGGTVIVSVPSHSPVYRRRLDSLVAAHRDELRDAERLIIDLRGNEGGSASTTDALLPYIASEGQRPSPLSFRESLILSSPDQVAYARRAFGSDTLPRVRRLIARMEASPGALVPLFDSLDAPLPARGDFVIPGARRVAIITDRATVSAAEVLVMDGMRSDRVTVYGEPTAGALDYQSTSIVPLHPRERRWYLGYPTITASTSLPAGGMRGRGITPHVPLDLATLPDVIGHIEVLMRQTRGD